MLFRGDQERAKNRLPQRPLRYWAGVRGPPETFFCGFFRQEAHSPLALGLVQHQWTRGVNLSAMRLGEIHGGENVRLSSSD